MARNPRKLLTARREFDRRLERADQLSSCAHADVFADRVRARTGIRVRSWCPPEGRRYAKARVYFPADLGYAEVDTMGFVTGEDRFRGTLKTDRMYPSWYKKWTSVRDEQNAAVEARRDAYEADRSRAADSILQEVLDQVGLSMAEYLK